MSQLLSDEQSELQATLRRFLTTASPLSAVRQSAASAPGYDQHLWKRLANELGVTGLAVPEQFGGAGYGLPELTVACEEIGRALVPGPYFASCVHATLLLLELDDPDASADLLPGIAAGDIIAAVGVGAAKLQATESAGGWSVSGSVEPVVSASMADVLLVAADVDGATAVFAVDPSDSGVTLTPLTGLDTTRAQSRVTLREAPGRRIGGATVDAALARARDAVAVCLAAELLGVIGRSVELTVDYAKQRVQFGRVIGSFQAVKHGCADMWVRLELATSAVRHAASARTPDERAKASALALAYCSVAAAETTADMIQYHGGIAYTWEFDAHLYYRRARSAAVLLGPAREHRDRLAGLIGL